MIAELVKAIAVDAVEADKPVTVMYGTVAGVEPLVVDIEQKLRLFGEQLTVLKGVVLQEGDGVVLLREQGGQRFVVIGGV